MNKSFKQRLEALEALEAAAEQARAPLSDDDCFVIFRAIENRIVTMDASYRLVCYSSDSSLDLPLVRCNTALAALSPPLTTLEDIDVWLRDLPDPDSFDDDELIAEIFRLLVWAEESDPILTFVGGSLRARSLQSAALQRYGAGIAARGAPLLVEHSITFFPLLPATIRAAIEQLDAGVITCEVRSGATSHSSIVRTAHPPPTNRNNSLHTCLWRALDEYMYQTGCTPVQSTDELRADLVAALEQFKLEESA